MGVGINIRDCVDIFLVIILVTVWPFLAMETGLKLVAHTMMEMALMQAMYISSNIMISATIGTTLVTLMEMLLETILECVALLFHVADCFIDRELLIDLVRL